MSAIEIPPEVVLIAIGFIAGMVVGYNVSVYGTLGKKTDDIIDRIRGVTLRLDGISYTTQRLEKNEYLNARALDTIVSHIGSVDERERHDEGEEPREERDD